MKNRLVVLLAGLSLGVLAACGGVSTGEPLGEPAQVDPVTHTPFCYACPVAPGQVEEMATRTPVADERGELYCLPCEGDGYCGDGMCSGFETCSSCSYDCGTCQPTTWCGDGACNGGESCSSCPGDCGSCQPTTWCGDGVCNGGESCSSCPGDCGSCSPGGYCGDGICEYPETRYNCRVDCLYTCIYACP